MGKLTRAVFEEIRYIKSQTDKVLWKHELRHIFKSHAITVLHINYGFWGGHCTLPCTYILCILHRIYRPTYRVTSSLKTFGQQNGVTHDYLPVHLHRIAWAYFDFEQYDFDKGVKVNMLTHRPTYTHKPLRKIKVTIDTQPTLCTLRPDVWSHDCSQTLKSDGAKWLKMIKMTMASSFLSGIPMIWTKTDEAIASRLVCLSSSCGHGSGDVQD